MFKNLSYKRKNILLLAGSVMFGLIVYFYAFERTIGLIKECTQLEEQLRQAENAPQKLAELKRKLNSIESDLGGNGNFGGDIQQALLEKISRYCNENNIALREFPQPVVSQEQDYIIETNIVVIEGSFLKLLKLVYQLEQVQRTGKVAAVHFLAKEDLRTKRQMLTASLYLQNIKKL